MSTASALLRQYADLLRPWAAGAAARMLEEVDRRDVDAWRALSAEIAGTLRRDVLRAPIGAELRALLERQVDLIQSIPRTAAQRVHEMTLKGLEDSERANEYVSAIQRSGHVAKSHAILIARTEVARTSTELTRVRAQHAGSETYIWRTAHDSDVRPGHKAMEGKICRWDDPPAVNENGRIMHHHPGAIWNCRCWPEVIVIAQNGREFS